MFVCIVYSTIGHNRNLFSWINVLFELIVNLVVEKKATGSNKIS